MSRANLFAGPANPVTVICGLGEDAAQNVTIGGGEVLALSQNSVLPLQEPGAISLSCRKSSGPVVSVSQRWITAVQVFDITVQ